MRILVTGGAGFVGFNILSFLRKKHPTYDLIGLDNLKRLGSEGNVKKIIDLGIKFVHSDLKHKDELESIGDVDYIIHCASDSSVLSGIKSSSSLLLDNNLIGSINLFEFAVIRQAKIIFFSTNRVYPINTLRNIKLSIDESRFSLKDDQNILGVSQDGISEDFPIDSYKSFYGASKFCSEVLLDEYLHFKGLDYIVNRFGVISGAGQFGVNNQGIISYWLKSHLLKKPLKYIGYGGTGLQVRDALHINDVCEIIDIQLHDFNKLTGETFNIGGGNINSFSLQELTNICKNKTGNTIDITMDTDTREGDIPYYITDNTKISSRLGWKPKYSLNDIIDDIYDWYIEDIDMLNHF